MGEQREIVPAAAASMCCPQRRRLVSPPLPSSAFLYLLRQRNPVVSDQARRAQAATPKRSGSRLPRTRRALRRAANSSLSVAAIRWRRHRTQSVHRIMHDRDTTVTEATAGLISGSSHTASCQFNGMKILLASNRGQVDRACEQASKQASISVCCPPPKRLRRSGLQGRRDGSRS